MTTLAEFMIIAEADNRPPMFEKSLYDSWKSRMELYMENRENEKMILNSLQNGPLVWLTVVEEDGTTRTKKYEELSVAEKLQADCDLKATNITSPSEYKVSEQYTSRMEQVYDGRLVVPMFNQGDDTIACLNKAMAFLTAVASSRILLTNNQLRTSSNPRNQATIQNGKESDQILDEVQRAFLTDSGTPDGQVPHITIPNTTAFQIEDLDAYDSDYDDVSNAKAVFDGYSFQLCQHAASLVIDDEETLILEEASQDLPKVSLVNTSLIKLKYHHGQFDAVVKKRITPDAITEGEWDVLISVMNSTTLNGESVNLHMQRSESSDKCFDLDAELLKSQNAYNDLSKSYSQLEKYCISLKLTMQLNQEIFQKDSFCDNQNALKILEYFENNDLKAQLQAKDTTICKLKEHIKSMKENDKEEKVKQEMDEIETINIELDHSVGKLLFENERLHKEIDLLKKIYKDQFDSIIKTRALSKEHIDSLIAQLNSKSMENADLKGQIQENVFVTTALQNELRRLKGLKSSTSASRSQPICNKKNDRISQSPSNNMKNKVEVQRRRVKSKSNKKNHVKDPICDATVKDPTMLNANSELIFVICKQCMFDANHDVCFLDFVNNVNVRSKSKSDKKCQ
ncbi:hypothetical protein Tco_0454401 [Tanacetum coccineum]